MKLPAPQHYDFRIKPKKCYEVRLAGESTTGFSTPATQVCPKLYVVTCGAEIHYVGVTNRPMSARINMGLKAKGKGGYHGYKWKSIKSLLRLTVWSFPHESGKPFLRQLETVEAEFAYRVRKDTNHWPLSQTEIHFYQASAEHLQAVDEMFTQCTQ